MKDLFISLKWIVGTIIVVALGIFLFAIFPIGGVIYVFVVFGIALEHDGVHTVKDFLN